MLYSINRRDKHVDKTKTMSFISNHTVCGTANVLNTNCCMGLMITKSRQNAKTFVYCLFQATS